MSKKIPKLLVIDILQCIDKIEEYTRGFTLDQFINDGKTQDAVVRNLQIIGEAASKIPVEVRSKFPSVEWSKIIRTRHIIVHDYDVVDHTIVWRIVTTHLPASKHQIQQILDTL